MSHTPVVSSSLVAAIAAAMPSTLAVAGTATYTDQASFENGALGAGLTQAYVEDFEGFSITGGYVVEPTPWTGLGDGTLSMASSLNDFVMLVKGSYYFASVPTNAAGTIENRTTIIGFDGGVFATGFDIYGTSTFTASYFDTIDYTVFDTGGGVLASGSFAASGALGGGAYFGVTSTSLIGEVHITATAFGLGAQDFEDNIQGWVPSPGAGTVLAIGGLACTRRRRR